MRCANCGTSFESPFCPECGAAAQSGQPNNVERMPAQQTMTQPVNYQPMMPMPQYQQPYQQPPVIQQIHTVVYPVQLPQQKNSGITVAKTIIGILCMVMFLFIWLLSCSASCTSSFSETDPELFAASSIGGFFVGMFFLTAGIISTAGRRSRGASIAAMIMFIITAIIGFSVLGAYYELIFWALLAAALALTYLIFFLVQAPEGKARY